MNTTPDHITSLQPDEVFVFGSNYAGRHGKGAALTALRKFGARSGQGMGAMGDSYGIATKGWKLDVLPLPKIAVQVERFLRYAAQHTHKTFLVTEIGCGLAGYDPRDIAPMFRNPTANVFLPDSFWRALSIPAHQSPSPLSGHQPQPTSNRKRG
jgi:hypothetical protein